MKELKTVLAKCIELHDFSRDGGILLPDEQKREIAYKQLETLFKTFDLAFQAPGYPYPNKEAPIILKSRLQDVIQIFGKISSNGPPNVLLAEQGIEILDSIMNGE